MNLSLNTFHVTDQGVLADSRGPIYLWPGLDLEKFLSEDELTGFLESAKIDSVSTTDQGVYTIVEETNKIVLTDTSDERINLEGSSSIIPTPDIPVVYPEEIEFNRILRDYENTIKSTRGLGFSSKDKGIMYDVYGQLFIPKDDTGTDYYGHYLTINEVKNFYDLNDLGLSNNALILITFKNTHEVLFTDLTSGAFPEEGLVIDNKTITSERLIKRLDIYYEDSNSLQL